MRLWQKLTLAGLLLLAAVLGVVQQATSRLLADSITHRLRKEGADLAGPLSAALVAPLLQQDFATVQAVLDDIAADGNLRSLRLTDSRGRSVANSGVLVQAGLAPTAGGLPFADAQGRLWMSFQVPLQTSGQALGELRYTLSAQALSDGLDHLHRRLLQVTLLSVTVFGALVVAVSRWLTAPLRRLTHAARRMQQGDYGADLPPDRDDEIGQLAGSLAALRDAIRERMHQLGSARDAAEAASRAKSAFLANTSHELRTPLNGLLGMARLARQPDLDPARRQQYLDLVADSAQHLADILSDTLDLARIEAGKLVVQVQPFELRPLLQGVLSAHHLLAEQAGLTLGLQVEDAVPPVVQGDALRLRQILGNYLSNAIKFTPSGQVTVRVQVAGAGRLRLSVQDTGPGLAPDLAARLFSPFTQADASTTRRHGGTGLGLAICRELARRMDGEVGVHSQPGAGSTFWAELRLPAGSLPEAPPAIDNSALQRLHGARVLMTDDHPVNRMLAAALLQRWGLVVTQAQDGQQAVAAVAAAFAAGQPFDIVLMDVQMPLMDGHDATRALRQAWPGRRLPVIALTAASMPSEREAALAAGMDDFLSKPLDADQLLRLLCRHVRPAVPGTGPGPAD